MKTNFSVKSYWIIVSLKLIFSNALKNLSDGGRRSYEAMTYTPQHIANYFLDRADLDQQPMTQLRLLKLVYIAYGWHLALTSEKLFDEPIEAWKHGPVIESLYHEFKHYRSNPINERSTQIDLDTWEEITPRVPRSDNRTILILEKVWAAYRKFRAWDLRNKTHEDDGPWHRVYKEGLQHTPIKDDDIREHYAKRIKAYIDVAKTLNVK